MSYEGFQAGEASPTERRVAILEYIKKITIQEQVARADEGLHVDRFLELSEGVTAEHHRRVNRGLKKVEGIPAQLGQPDGSQLPILLQEWHGIDLENDQNHLWSVRLQDDSGLTMVVSFPAEALHQETIERLAANG